MAANRDHWLGLAVKRAAKACVVCQWSAPEGLALLRGSRLEDMLHSHHVIPLVCGGADAESNLVALCARCHAIAHALGRMVTPRNQPGQKTRKVWVGPQTPQHLIYELDLVQSSPEVWAGYLASGRNPDAQRVA